MGCHRTAACAPMAGWLLLAVLLGAPRLAPAQTPVQPKPIGTPHPISVVAASPSRSWVVICQARRDTDHRPGIVVTSGRHGGAFGDHMDVYLVEGHGAGEPIDAYVDHDPSGRYLVYQRGKRYLLRDVQTGHDVPLPIAHTRAADGLPVSIARFAPQGGYLAYRRRHGDQDRVVVRSLSDGAEHRVDHGPGRLWDFGAGRRSEWLHLRVIARDKNGNGQLDPPQRFTSHSGNPCGHALSSSYFEQPVDPIETRVVPFAGGERHVLGKRIRTVGPHLVTWQKGRWHWLDTQSQERRPLVPTGCEALQLMDRPPYPRVLAACELGDGQGRRLRYFEPGRAAVTFPHPPTKNQRGLSIYSSRLWPIRKGDGYLDQLDVKTGRTVRWDKRGPFDDYGNLVVLRGGALLLEHLDTGATTVLRPAPYHPLHLTGHRQGPILLVDRLLIDLRAGKLLGSLPGRPLALSNDGHALLPDPGNEAKPLEHMARRMATGPLRWRRPNP